MGLQPLSDGGRTSSRAPTCPWSSPSRLVAAGFEHKRAYLSFQEYFERLRTEAERWGKPMAAVLGALMAQVDLGVGAIGGKDSMSGSLRTRPASSTFRRPSSASPLPWARRPALSRPSSRAAGHRVVRIAPATYGQDYRPDAQQLLAAFDAVEALTAAGDGPGRLHARLRLRAESLFQDVRRQPDRRRACRRRGRGEPLHPALRQLYRRARRGCRAARGRRRRCRRAPGHHPRAMSSIPGRGHRARRAPGGLGERHRGRLPVSQRRRDCQGRDHRLPARDIHVYSGAKIARPRVVIPVFPGNNCEYDSAAPSRAAGAEADTFVINNLTPEAVAESTDELARRIRAKPDRHDPRRLLGRRRARWLRQVHHGVLPRSRGRRGSPRPARRPATA